MMLGKHRTVPRGESSAGKTVSGGVRAENTGRTRRTASRSLPHASGIPLIGPILDPRESVPHNEGSLDAGRPWIALPKCPANSRLRIEISGRSSRPKSAVVHHRVLTVVDIRTS